MYSNSDISLNQRFAKYRRHLLFILFFGACVLGVIGMYQHEMWRDESQAFLLVRDSKNLKELWQNVRYEGHPILWHFILFVAHHISPSIYTIQIVHILIGLSVVALIIFYSPFFLSEKLLLTFSYFFSFEYLVISRNYSIGIFFLFLSLCVFDKLKHRKSLIYIAIILGLSANANIYSFIISCCLFAYFLSYWFPLQNKSSYKSKPFYVSSGIFIFFLVIALLQLIAPPDRTPKLEIAANVDFNRMVKICKEIAQVLFYLPDPMRYEKYWGFSVFGGNYFKSPLLNNLFFYLPHVLTLVAIILLVSFIKKSRGILLFFTGASVGVILFMYFFFDRGLFRHTGVFFILLITVLWLYRSSFKKQEKYEQHFNNLFKLMLSMQFAGSVIAHIYEAKYSFSGAKDAAAFLINTNRNNGKIILHPDFEGMALLHYGKIDSVFYPTINKRGSFIKFSNQRKPRSYKDIYHLALRNDIETMVFNSRKSDSVINSYGYELIYKPPKTSTVHDEDFWIYGKRQQNSR